MIREPYCTVLSLYVLQNARRGHAILVKAQETPLEVSLVMSRRA